MEEAGESPAPLFQPAAAGQLQSPPASPSPSPPPPPRLISNKRGRVPASSKAIQSLPEVTATNDSDDCCAICLQDFGFQAETTTPLKLRAMPCSHTFHQDCIFEWLRRNAACPLCRHQLPTEEEDDDDKEQEQQGRVISRSRLVYYNEQDVEEFFAMSLRTWNHRLDSYDNWRLW